MKTSPKIVMLILFLLVLCCLSSGILMSQEKKPDHDERKNKSMLLMMMQAERPIAFYGKVVDQFNKPVEGAEVVVHVKTFKFNPIAFLADDIKDVILKTNKNGEFSYKKHRGLHILIAGVKRAGYEYDRHRAIVDNCDSADYEEGQIPKASNPATPAIFHMRKLGEQTFLFIGGGNLSFKATEYGVEKGFDVIRHEPVVGEALTTGQSLGAPIVPDLKARAFWDGKERTWTLELSAGTPGGGLLVADHKLYEAPAEGYQPTYAFKVRLPKAVNNQELPTVIFPGKPPREVRLTRENPPSEDQVLHLYLRTRQPWIYTRIEWEFPKYENYVDGNWIIIGERSLLGNSSISVNPYGGRNLEQAQDLPWDVGNMLKNEIRESYRRNPNGRPPKPDLVKLTQEWKKQQSLGEKAKGLFK